MAERRRSSSHRSSPHRSTPRRSTTRRRPAPAAQGRKPARRRPSPEVQHRRALARLILLMLAFIAFLFVFVFPIRTLLAQREEQGRVRDQLELLEEQSELLEKARDGLLDDREVERLAREQYNMVRPGETPYTVVTPSDSTTTTTTTP